MKTDMPAWDCRVPRIGKKEDGMKIHYLMHVPFEGLGSIETWALGNGHRLSATRLYDYEMIPEIGDFDWLVVMGGPMGIYDEEDYPWLKAEKILIRQAVQCGKVVIGICLGAQLIADILGAKVRRGKHREIGWFPVTTTPFAREVFSELPGELTVFHWHGDTFDIPDGAERIAGSEGCENQAFVFNKRVFGFQFHLETTGESARALIENCGNELTEGPYIQSKEEILADPERFVGINGWMEKLLFAIEKRCA